MNTPSFFIPGTDGKNKSASSAVCVSSYISCTTKKSKFSAAFLNSSLLAHECLGFVHTTHNPFISPEIALSII